MKRINLKNYHCDLQIDNNHLSISDHLGGFDQQYFSPILETVINTANQNNIDTIYTGYVLDEHVKNQYPKIKFFYKQDLIGGAGWEDILTYNMHPELDYKNFVCSFNGTAHVSRKLLVTLLQRFGYFNPEFCSKNFVFTRAKLDGHLQDHVDDRNQFYRKFFISNDSEKFFNMVNSFGHVRFDHAQNIYNLEHRLTRSFLHIVSETMATSYVPFVTEKFLYSIVTRGLFLAYAQPGWHAHVENYYGFKRYTKLFDYRFDIIQNPVERLVELMCMISKFGTLSVDDWSDLYLIEQDNIEFNYDHYFSGDYLTCLTAYNQ
jgi:hypothetical protein